MRRLAAFAEASQNNDNGDNARPAYFHSMASRNFEPSVSHLPLFTLVPVVTSPLPVG